MTFHIENFKEVVTAVESYGNLLTKYHNGEVSYYEAHQAGITVQGCIVRLLMPILQKHEMFRGLSVEELVELIYGLSFRQFREVLEDELAMRRSKEEF